MNFLVEYRAIKKGATKDDFFLNTTAEWKSCEAPQCTPDFVSPSGSAYFYTDDGVIRLSNHWAGVASCCWYLDNDCTVRRALPVAGFCLWDDFEREVTVREEKEMPKGTRAKTWAVVGFQGYKVLSKIAK